MLDEPLASLDPLARQEVLGWLMTCVAEDGLSVVFSSHVIAELERVATYLVVLSQGQVQVAATVDSLLDSHLALTGPAADADHLAGQVPVITVQRAGRQVRVLARTGAAPPGWAARPVTMEELVLGYLREPSAPRAAPTGGGAMTALMIKAINVPRMTRVTWYKHRALVLGISGLFLLAAALLVIDSVLQRHWISSHHFTYCLAYADNATSSRCLTQDSPYLLGTFAGFVNYWRTEGAVVAVLLLAAVTGLFAGVPWAAREFEGGGFRFTWTQSVSPLRWLLGTFGPLTLLAGVTAAICGVAAHWWFQVAQFRLNGGTTPWGWESLEMTPLSLVSWTLLAMALALLLGVTIRRVLPAMIAFAVTFGGCLVLAQTWLPEFLFRVGDIPLQLNYSTQEYPTGGSYVAQMWFAVREGPSSTR